MKRIIVIINVLMIFTLALQAQDKAIVIKHIGEQDKSIYPFFITNYEVSVGFSDKYLKHMEGMKKGPIYFIDTVLVNNSVFNNIDSCLNHLVDMDSVKRTFNYGSFLISWIENDLIIKQVETTNKNEALKLFYAFSDSIKGLSMFEGKYKLLRIIDDKICRMYMEEAGCDPPPNNR